VKLEKELVKLDERGGRRGIGGCGRGVGGGMGGCGGGIWEIEDDCGGDFDGGRS